jgi:hypothetical protein
MTVAAEEQRDSMAVAQGDHARGIQTPAILKVVLCAGQRLLPGAFAHQFQDLDRRT